MAPRGPRGPGDRWIGLSRYAITSFSRTDEGFEKGNREKLVRFRVDGDRLVDGRVVRGLKRALTGRHPALARAAAVRDVKNGGGLNIESLDVCRISSNY